MEELLTVIDPVHETISSARVQGTRVSSRSGEPLGTIHSLMIGKRSGKVGYAILWLDTVSATCGTVFPVAWEMLTYDPERHSYAVDLDPEALSAAPTLTLDEADRPTDRALDDRIFDFWGIAPVWGSGPLDPRRSARDRTSTHIAGGMNEA
jgi:hypothetical protein